MLFFRGEVIPLLGGGFKYLFMFTPIFGEMIQFDEYICQIGVKPPTSLFLSNSQLYMIASSRMSLSCLELE